jgi:hypothetical protein
MRLRSGAFLFLAAFLAALLARGSSTGREIIGTGREYLQSLSAKDTETAYSLLTDSLAQMLSHEILSSMEGDGAGGIRSGRMEARGFTLSSSSSQGGSRTLWLRREPSGEWRISGDTSLDNLLGRATVICSAFARATVIPALADGAEAGDFSCPVSGRPYRLEESSLRCEAGHLGEGLETGGADCARLRDSLACVIEEYMTSGHGYPSSFAEMYTESGGVYGQRGGFHCPDEGYSYYRITPEGIFCPYHGQTTRVGSSLGAPVDPGQE